MEVTFGTTTVIITVTTSEGHDHHHGRVGQGARDLALEAVLGLEDVGEAREHLVELARASPAATMLMYRSPKILGCARSATLKRDAFVDLVARVGERGAQLFLLGLLDQRVERLDQRDARLEQRRQLARGEREVRACETRENSRLKSMLRASRFSRRALFLELRDEHALRLQRAARRALGLSASSMPLTSLPAALMPRHAKTAIGLLQVARLGRREHFFHAGDALSTCRAPS